jgi:predicted Zn-dependent protease
MTKSGKIMIAAGMLVLAVACSKVPISGRRQINMLPENTLMSMSLTQYREFLRQNPPVPESNQDAQMIKRVGQRIQRAVQTYMRRKRLTRRIKNFKWEFNLVQNNAVNAWCMPGGRIVFYTGILPVTQNESGVAVVMGHEVAHAVARHGNERMSQQLLVMGGGLTLAILTRDKPREARDLFLSAYGVGGSLGILAYSRTHETEADKMGMVFMSIAGYDPEAAIGFWERMASLSKGPKPPEIVSTHPSDDRRIRDIRAFIPKAKRYFQPS